MSTEKESERRLPALDGVRGIAILAVLAYHFVHGMDQATPFDVVFHDALRCGWAGVDLFFALSGFLITGILLDSKGEAGYFKRFYLRRAVRIFPLYYATLFLFFVVAPRVVSGPSWMLDSERPYQLWYWAYAANVLMEIRGGDGVLGHFWTLAVEEQFYLIWPLVVLLVPRRGVVAIGCAAVVGGYFLRRFVPHEPSLPLVVKVLITDRAEGLLLGGSVAAFLRGPGGAEILRRAALPAFAVGVAWCVGTFLCDAAHVARVGAIAAATTPVAIAAAAFVAFGAVAPAAHPIAKVLSTAPLRFFGKYSYAVYVFHPLVFAATSVRFDASWVPSPGGSGVPARLVLMALCTSATIAAATISWHLWEKRWLKLKSRF